MKKLYTLLVVFLAGCAGGGTTSSLQITTSSLPEAVVGSEYSQQLTAAGGVPPYKWSATGILPPGIQFNNGLLSGKPEMRGGFDFTVQVVDSNRSAAQIQLRGTYEKTSTTSNTDATGDVQNNASSISAGHGDKVVKHHG